MTDLVLDISTQFGKGLIITLRTENRIIAKSLYPTPFTGNLSLYDTFEEMLLLDAGATARTNILL
jgi:hypothetical protein